MKRLLFLACALLAMALVVTSCSSSSPTGTDDGPPIGGDLPTVTVSGTLTMPAGSTLSANDLRALSFADEADLNSSGEFTLDVIDSDTFQIILFISKSTGNPVMMGGYNPQERSVDADSETTVLALTLMNPYLIYTSHADREDFFGTVELLNDFQGVVSDFEAALASDAETALDYNTNTVLYQDAADLGKTAMDYLGGARGGRGAPPTIVDASGGDVAFLNERHVWYVASVHDAQGALLDVVTVDRDQCLNYIWGWPPTVEANTVQTAYTLGDGSFYICMRKGGDFSKFGQWSDAIGRATTLNTCQAAIDIVQLIVGYTCEPEMEDLGDELDIPALYANELTQDLRQGRAERLAAHYSELMQTGNRDFAVWLWGGGVPSTAPEDYVDKSGEILGGMGLVLELLSYVNDSGPFFWDWAYAEEDLCYYLVQSGGMITTIDEYHAPIADFTISPPAGIIGTDFDFDASISTDDYDDLVDLEFRWDWDSDGTWDHGWTSTETATHSYSEAGAYTVTLQVKDSDGLIGVETHNVNVGGGAGTANHIKLFMDAQPWNSYATTTVIEALGFTLGAGPNTYEILYSTDMATAELIPGEDLVIICNDQYQSFYDNYAASQIRFNNFVYMGGSLLWEACDEGWHYGSMETAGIILPGDVHPYVDFDYYNYVTDPNLPLVSGLPGTLDHNYASHESFYNLPDGTTVYTVDDSDNPTLIEYSLGGGWVIISGQPLEHQYDNDYGVADDVSQLLPRIVAYFTGKALPAAKAVSPAVVGTEARPSHE